MTKPDKPRVPGFYYDTKTGGYWMELPNERRLLPLDGAQLKLHLRLAGLVNESMGGHGLTEIELSTIKCQRERNVAYAGPLAGHPVGLFTMSNGSRILVTEEPGNVFAPASHKVKGTPKEFPTLWRLFSELFGDEQIGFVFAWLKCARESLLARDFRPGQMLVIAGPSNCGKSLFQQIVTEFLGGRVAKPYRYMIGETAFNSDLCSCEHLMIEDENASSDIRSRRKFGTSIKEYTVNREISVHAKGRMAVTLPTFKRLTASVNNEPENLMILPPLDSSILDKLMLFKAGMATVGKDRLKYWAQLTAELPALIRYLAKFKIPDAMQCPRFGVVAWHHPELLESVNALSPEMRLMGILNDTLFNTDKGSGSPIWTGTTEEFEKEMKAGNMGYGFDKICYTSSVTGTYLHRLQVKFPDRFDSKRTNYGKRWTIKAPPPEAEPDLPQQ